MNRLGGVIIPVAVPLDSERRPDLDAYAKLIERLLDAGVHGIFANGSMGAFALLEDAQQDALIRQAVDVVAGRVPTLAGVSDTSPDRVLRRMERLAALPVDAFVVMPPYFFLTGQPELIRFYTLIADRSPKPLLLYDNPRLTKNAIHPPTVAELAAHPNIAGIKASSPDVDWWKAVLASPLPRDRFALISGAGRQSNAALELGFDGITEGLHNIVPHLAVELYATAQAGDFARAAQLQHAINECFGIFEEAGGWRGLEIAFQWMGIAPCAALPPYDLPVSAESRQRIETLLLTHGVARPFASKP